RLWFGYRTKKYSNQLKIDADKCIGCSKCVKLCPTENIAMEGKKAKAGDRCTVCYRCVNACPVQAITLLGKKVVEQTNIEKFVD
ncbi:MAG: 4Fe-4S dicluster domain-containing protein, partial [Lachnospiraceae bacterium]|nr:4Fe-4S dicluster domain-containing protein [Lachnospiraceae bacterium]